MDSPWFYYGRLLGLLAVLVLIVGFNVAVWGLRRHPSAPALYVPGADAQRGRMLVQQYGCGACHVIPGVRGARGEVGPRLDRLKYQVYIGGVAPNSPENLSSWIAHPKQIDPRTAMPDLGVNENDARDIAAYLYSVQ